MNETEMMYIAVGFILALTGFGLLAMQTFQAWKGEKRKIEEDFALSKQYEPSKSMGTMMVFIMITGSSLMYILVMTLLLSIVCDDSSLPVASDLVAKFIMLMGATSLIGNIARMPNLKESVGAVAYVPRFPDSIKAELEGERDLNRRYEIMEKFVEENGLNRGRWYFGKDMVINVIPETNNIYIFMIAEMLMIFTGLMGDMGDVQDISPEFSSAMFATGVLFVILTIPSIFYMKKAAEIEMNEKNFGKKILMVVYGAIPPIIGLVLMMYKLVSIMG